MNTQRKHKWGDSASIPRTQSPSGCEETERRCLLCAMVKITVHPPAPELPYRAWRTRDGFRASVDHTPPCNPVGVVEAMEAPAGVPFS